MKLSVSTFLLTLIVLGAVFTAGASYAEEGDMCAENSKCVACREDLKCQKCYYGCANKYGPFTQDERFAYKLSPFDINALNCYKDCWGDGPDSDNAEKNKEEDTEGHAGSNRSYQKMRKE